MKNYHNLEKKVCYVYGQRVVYYRGYGSDGFKYNVSVFIKSRRHQQHWQAHALYNGQLAQKLPKGFYARTLAEISAILDNL